MFGAIMDLSVWVTYSGQRTLDQYLAISAHLAAVQHRPRRRQRRLLPRLRSGARARADALPRAARGPLARPARAARAAALLLSRGVAALRSRHSRAPARARRAGGPRSRRPPRRAPRPTWRGPSSPTAPGATSPRTRTTLRVHDLVGDRPRRGGPRPGPRPARRRLRRRRAVERGEAPAQDRRPRAHDPRRSPPRADRAPAHPGGDLVARLRGAPGSRRDASTGS